MGRLRKATASIAILFGAMGSVYADEPIFETTDFAPVTVTERWIATKMVAYGMTSPLKGVRAAAQADHLYVVDQPGLVWAVDITQVNSKQVVLDLRDLIVPLGFCQEFVGACGPDPVLKSFDERGLLGLAFHPEYETNGLFYTYTSEPVSDEAADFSTMPEGAEANHRSVISEWKAEHPDDANFEIDEGHGVAGRRIVMTIDQPEFNHNGGDMAFGHDGMLYIAIGDGGGANDGLEIDFASGERTLAVGHEGPNGNAQDRRNILGSIVRIDPLGRDSRNGQYGVPFDNPYAGHGDFAHEIWAYGFRNPFRMSFDMGTGILYVGDVGQNDLEEVNIVRKGGNYGWNFKEGTKFFHPPNEDPEGPGFASDLVSEHRTDTPRRGLIDPIAQYDTHSEGHSIILGAVYRGTALPRLYGSLIFGDFSEVFNFPAGPHNSGRIFTLEERINRRGALSTVLELQHDFKIGPVPESLGHHEEEEHAHDDDPSGHDDEPEITHSLALLGWGQDWNGEIYFMGNIHGLPFDHDGIMVKLTSRFHRH